MTVSLGVLRTDDALPYCSYETCINAGQLEVHSDTTCSPSSEGLSSERTLLDNKGEVIGAVVAHTA